MNHRGHASISAGAIIFILSIIASLITYFMGFTAITFPVIAGGSLLLIKEVIQYFTPANGKTTSTSS